MPVVQVLIIMAGEKIRPPPALDDLMHPSQKLIMPTSVRVARIIMSVQLAGAVFLFAILVIPLVLGGVFIPEALLVIVLIVGNGVAIGVVVFGMKSRRPWVRWMGVTIQALGVVVFVLVAVIEAVVLGLTTRRRITPRLQDRAPSHARR